MVDSATTNRELHCVVVTPERAILDESADFVALPLYDGELGVLSGRAPLIGRLGYGELRIIKGGVTHRFFVDGGFVQIRDNTVTVLTSRAIKAENIDAEGARRVLAEPLPVGAAAEARAARSKAKERARSQIRVSHHVHDTPPGHS
jgi:F-type H+-transporting ATPase subunit epsilon